jgi:hypothetical protein
MDQSFLARVIFVVTAIVLPIAAVMLLGSRASLRLTTGYWVPGSWHLLVKVTNWEAIVKVKIAAFSLASAISMLLGLLSWTSRPRMSQVTKPHCPAQLFE